MACWSRHRIFGRRSLRQDRRSGFCVWCNLLAGLDSIAASIFVLNWLSWQIVSDDKIQITILILRRGALSKGLFNKSLKNAHSVNFLSICTSVRIEQTFEHGISTIVRKIYHAKLKPHPTQTNMKKLHAFRWFWKGGCHNKCFAQRAWTAVVHYHNGWHCFFVS